MKMPEKEFNAEGSESRGSTSVVMAAAAEEKRGNDRFPKERKKTKEKKI